VALRFPPARDSNYTFRAKNNNHTSDPSAGFQSPQPAVNANRPYEYPQG